MRPLDFVNDSLVQVSPLSMQPSIRHETSGVILVFTGTLTGLLQHLCTLPQSSEREGDCQCGSQVKETLRSGTDMSYDVFRHHSIHKQVDSVEVLTL